MPYNRPRNPQPPQPPQPPQESPSQQTGRPSLKDTVVDTIKAPFQGFWQGFSGRNKTYEEVQRDKKRKKRGFPGSNPNWLQRMMNFK